MVKNKLILGHRGYSEIAPENTKLSFDAANLFKFDGVEIDVHKTKDNQLVVIHDETVDRTSDGVGEVRGFTLKELRKFNFAFQFNHFLEKQTIMTYEEFLKRYHNKFKCINVEIKTDIIQYEDIEKLIWSVHTKIKPKCEVIYSSFNFKTLQLLRKIAPKSKIGFLFVDEKDIRYIEKELLETCDYIHPWFKSLTKKTSLSFYEKLKLPINPWTYDLRDSKDEWVKGSKKSIESTKDIKNIHALISNSRI